MRRSILIILAAAVVAGQSSPAWSEDQARPGWVISRVTVPLNDLNLTTEAGADILLSRLSGAARRVCGDRPLIGPQMAELTAAFRACKVKAFAMAVAQVDAPLVKERFAKRPDAPTVRVAEVLP